MGVIVEVKEPLTGSPAGSKEKIAQQTERSQREKPRSRSSVLRTDTIIRRDHVGYMNSVIRAMNSIGVRVQDLSFYFDDL